MQDMEEIYKQYSKVVYKYIFCLTQNEELSKEIVQETFLVAVKNSKQFRGNSKITTWLCQIAKFIWYKELKKRHKEIPLEEIENHMLIEASVEERICDNEEKIELLKQIQKLEEETRNVMYLRILGNLEYNEIADIVGKTPNWARVTFFRGKEKIKEEKQNEKRM